MRKYIIRYLIFWLPAVLVAYFYNRPDTASHIAQWFAAFIMLFGWSINTGMCAYYFPRRTLALILMYLGVSVLVIIWMYSAPYASATHNWLRLWGGVLNFKPLEILLMAILEFNVRHELVVTYTLGAFCLLGYIVGIIYRYIRPDPYKPKMMTG